MLVRNPRNRRQLPSVDPQALMVDYFHKGDDLFLRGMGVDRAKLSLAMSWPLIVR